MTVEVRAWRRGQDDDGTGMRPSALTKKIRGLGITDRVPVKVLAAALAEHRQRPLRLKAVHMPPGHTGHVLVTPHADVVFYALDGWGTQKVNAIAHELGHLLHDHQGAVLNGQDIARIFAPDIDPDVVVRLLGRSGFTEPEEKAAETTAMDLVLDHLTDDLPDAGEWVGPDDLRQRLLTSLGIGS